MPYKRGPNGTLRYYRKSDGRYSNDPLIYARLSDKAKKKSGLEKELERRRIIYNLALKSKDENLFDIYKIIEENCPGSVTHVNAKLFDKRIKNLREFDIISKSALYEIKSGRARHNVKQFLKQKKIAEELKKEHIVFSPGSTSYQIKCLNKMGINAFNDIDLLKKYIRSNR